MKKIIILFLCSSFLFCFGQARKTSNSKELIYNVSIGAVLGTLGALMNKKEDDSFKKFFLKGFCQGALGGYVTFESKKLVDFAQKKNDWKFFWAAKIVNAAGTSIKENASSNNNFWEKWHINIGFSRIELNTKDSFHINYKIMPISLIYTIAYSTNSKFELNKTLQTGEFIFSQNSDDFLEKNPFGKAFPGGMLVYEPYKNNIYLISHEIIHLYQFNDFSQSEALLIKPLSGLNNTFLKKTSTFLHYDFRYLPSSIFYFVADKNSVYYFDNIFEREAAFYSNTFNQYLLK